MQILGNELGPLEEQEVLLPMRYRSSTRGLLTMFHLSLTKADQSTPVSGSSKQQYEQFLG